MYNITPPSTSQSNKTFDSFDKEASRRPMVDMKDLVRSIAQMGEDSHRTTVAQTLYSRVARRKLLLKKMVGVCQEQTCGKRFSGLMRPTLIVMVLVQSATFVRNVKLLITLRTSNPW